MKKITMLRDVYAALDESGIATAWFLKGAEYSSASAPPLTDFNYRFFLEGGYAVDSSELGLAPPAETEIETALDMPTETTAICGRIKGNGEVCEERRPCRYHDRKPRD